MVRKTIFLLQHGLNARDPHAFIYTYILLATIMEGLIMESPNFPLKPGRYLVTGARSVTTGLTVEPNGHWKLDKGTLYDVTHLPCRSARYNPVEQGGGSPAAARLSDFPVKPGAVMVSLLQKMEYMNRIWRKQADILISFSFYSCFGFALFSVHSHPFRAPTNRITLFCL